MITLRRVVVNREPARPAICPPLPRRTSDAEPVRLLPIAETQARRRVRAPRLREALRRLRDRLIQWRDRSVRDAWAAGYQGGRLVERTEIAAHIRAELVRGAYDYRTSADAVREVLAHLDREQQER